MLMGALVPMSAWFCRFANLEGHVCHADFIVSEFMGEGRCLIGFGFLHSFVRLAFYDVKCRVHSQEEQWQV